MMYFYKKSTKTHRTSSKYRLLKYLQKAVALNGALEVNDLIGRFCKTAKLNVSEQTKCAWKKWLRANSKKNNLYFFKSIDNSFRVTEKVILHREEKNQEYAQRKNVFADSIKKELKERKVEVVSVYDTLKKLGLSSKALERPINKLKKMAFLFGLEFFKKGRILMAKLKSITNNFLSKNTPHVFKALILDNKLKRKEVYRNTGKPAFRINSNLNKKAHCLVKELKALFWENCKVSFHFGICFNFVKWALQEAFLEKDIKKFFRHALETRHGDATDWGLNHGDAKFMFHLSSTVSLTKELLVKNSNENRNQRIQNVINFLKNRVCGKKTVAISNQSIVENAPIKSNKTASFEDFASSLGFNKHQISSFFSFESASSWVQKQFLANSPTLANLFARLSSLKLQFNQTSI